VTFVHFLEIIDNIPETVQDRQSYNGSVIRDRTSPIEWHQIPVTFNDVEGHFSCLKPLTFSRLRAAMYTVKVVMSPKLCKIETLGLQIMNML